MTPFTEAELAPTRRPLLEASMLPPRAFTDESVAAWEAEHLFLGGWVNVGHASVLAERGAFVTRQIGGASPETSQNSSPSTTAVRTGVRPWQLGSKSTRCSVWGAERSEPSNA